MSPVSAGALARERDISLTLSDKTITFTGSRPDGVSGDAARVTLFIRGGSADRFTLTFAR